MISKKIIGIISVLAVIAVVFAGSAAAVSSTYATDSNILVSDFSQNLDSASANSLLFLNNDGTFTIARMAELSAAPANAVLLNDTQGSQIRDLAALKSMNMLNKASVGTTAAKLSRLNSAALQSSNANFANLQSRIRDSSLLAGLNTLGNNVIVCPVSDLNNQFSNLAGLNTNEKMLGNTLFFASLNNDGTFSIIPACVSNLFFVANTNEKMLGNTLNSSALQNSGLFFLLPVCLNVSNAELAGFLKADGTLDLARLLRLAANNVENETFSLSSDLQNMIQNTKDSAVSANQAEKTEFSIAGTKTVVATDDATQFKSKKIASNEDATVVAQKDVTFSADAKDNVLSPASGAQIIVATR